MSPSFTKVIIVTALAILLICAAGMYAVISSSEYQQQLAIQGHQAVVNASLSVTSAPSPGTWTAADQNDPNIVFWIIGVLVTIWILYKILSSEMAVPFVVIIVGIAVVIGATYIYGYGDKNGDGQSDPQIIRMVQPVGQIDVDRPYSAVNQTNAKTNWISMGTIVLYIFIMLAAVVVLTGMGLLLRRFKG